MYDILPAACPLMGAVHLEARKLWARLPKAGDILVSNCGLWGLSDPLPPEDLPGCFQRLL